MGGEEICESNELYKFLWLILSKATLSTICIINIPDGQTGRHLTPEKNHTKKTLLTSSCCLLWIPPQFLGGNTAPWKCAGNSERCLSAPCIHFISYSVYLRTATLDVGLGRWHQAPIQDGWFWMRHVLLQDFLENAMIFHLRREGNGNTLWWFLHPWVITLSSAALGRRKKLGPLCHFGFFFFRENRSAFILLGVSLSHLDVTITRKCQEWITVPFSTLVTAGGFCVSLKTKPPKCSRLENPFFGIYILPTPG